MLIVHIAIVVLGCTVMLAPGAQPLVPGNRPIGTQSAAAQETAQSPG